MKQLLLFCLCIAYNAHSQPNSVEWIHRIGDSGTDNTGAIATDINGNVYVAGGFVGQLVFNNDTLISPSISEPSAFLAKYDSLGNPLWGKILQNTNHTSFPLAGVAMKTIRISPSGRIYTVGYLDYNGATAAYISINRANGSQVIHYSNMVYAQHVDIDIDSADNSYLGGHFSGTAYNSYIMKLDSIGTVKWLYYSTQENRTSNVRYQNGVVYVAGQFRYQYTVSDTVGSTPIPLNATGGINDFDLFLAKYSKDGKLLSANKEDGITSSTGNWLECSGDFSKSLKWNICWSNSSSAMFFKQYDDNLAVLSTFQFLVTTPCPFQPGVYPKSNRFSEESVLSYSGLACPAYRNYILDSVGQIQDTIKNPTSGAIMGAIPSRDLALDRNSNLLILSEFTGTLNYSDSTGAKSLTSVSSSQDLFIAKLHKCSTNTPTIIKISDTLICTSPGKNYQWYLDGNHISGAVQNTWIPTTSGIYSIIVTDAWGCESSSSGIQVTVGIRSILQNSHLRIYPNPVTDILNVEGLHKGTRVELKNGLGQTVHWVYCNTNTYSIDMSGYPSGIYVLTAGDLHMKIIRK